MRRGFWIKKNALSHDKAFGAGKAQKVQSEGSLAEDGELTAKQARGVIEKLEEQQKAQTRNTASWKKRLAAKSRTS